MLLLRLNCLVVTTHLFILATTTRYQAIFGLRDSSYPVTGAAQAIISRVYYSRVPLSPFLSPLFPLITILFFSPGREHVFPSLEFEGKRSLFSLGTPHYEPPFDH